MVKPWIPIRIKIRGKGKKTELGNETARNIEPKV